MRLKSTALTLLLTSLFLVPSAWADVDATLSRWEASVDFTPPDKEHLQLYLDVKNLGTEKVAGVQIGIAADELKYIEEEAMTFEGEKTSTNLKVTVGRDQGKNIVTIIFPRLIEKGYSERVLVDFNAKGLLTKEGQGYGTVIRFDKPQAVMENGNRAELKVYSGSVRVHVPEGYIYTKYNPTPWREIWQGVSGFNAHYILIFDGGTPLTTPITVSFSESPIVKRAVEIYKKILEMETAKAMPQEDLDRANQHITEAATYLISGNTGSAEIDLDRAESILTGNSLESIPIKTLDEGTSMTGIYGLGIAFVVLVLVSLKFGKNIISTIGGRKSE